MIMRWQTLLNILKIGDKMKVTLSMEEQYQTRDTGRNDYYTEEEAKEDLTQMLFEVCEEWVLHGQLPILEWEK